MTDPLTAAELTAASKFLAYVLRHDPAAIGLALDDAGWVAADALLAAAARNGRALSAEALRGALYHGTVARFLPGILAEGLKPGQRVHVHLSADPGAAATVGARRGKPVVLRIDAAGMHAAGHEFFRAANGVWLTARVPPGFISPQR